MKLPRWMVIAMLAFSGITVLGAGCLYWFTWPDRTARRFLQLVSDGCFDDANRMMSSQSPIVGVPAANWWSTDQGVTFGPILGAHVIAGIEFDPKVWQVLCRRPPRFEPRAWSDALGGRRCFEPDVPFRFADERGKVSLVDDRQLRPDWLESITNDAEVLVAMGGKLSGYLRVWDSERLTLDPRNEELELFRLRVESER